MWIQYFLWRLFFRKVDWVEKKGHAQRQYNTYGGMFTMLFFTQSRVVTSRDQSSCGRYKFST